jgi:thiamine pyrophosphokinase
MHGFVVADGDRPDRSGLDAAWPGWDAGPRLVIAADGGARLADELGLPIDAWVGDGDSLDDGAVAELERRGIPIHRAPPDKDESDAELALVAAIERGATDVTILGALGGRRLDHGLANIALLAHPALGGRPARLLDAATRVTLVSAAGHGEAPVRRDLTGRAGDLVSLLPWGGRVEAVTTEGLRFQLHGEPLEAGPARGLSNVREAPMASVTIGRGRLLVVESVAGTARRASP